MASKVTSLRHELFRSEERTNSNVPIWDDPLELVQTLGLFFPDTHFLGCDPLRKIDPNSNMYSEKPLSLKSAVTLPALNNTSRLTVLIQDNETFFKFLKKKMKLLLKKPQVPVFIGNWCA